MPDALQGFQLFHVHLKCVDDLATDLSIDACQAHCRCMCAHARVFTIPRPHGGEAGGALGAGKQARSAGCCRHKSMLAWVHRIQGLHQW